MSLVEPVEAIDPIEGVGLCIIEQATSVYAGISCSCTTAGTLMQNLVTVRHRHFILIAVATVVLRADVASAADRPVTFEADVRPILKAHCFMCHGELGEREGGLDLRLRRLMVTGGDSGPAIEANSVENSLLLQRIRDGEMPPGDKKLTDDEIAVIAKWIASGAKTARAEPESIGDGPIFTEEERNWWSFRPVQRPDVPRIVNADVQTGIDAFVIERLRSTVTQADDAAGVRFAPRASRATLIRRACFDLVGLPPTPEEVAEFVADDSSDAWAQLIDRLLASPHYGERWGRHWLDVVGYADSEGYTDEDRVREHAFRYRDYVIASFNEDKPFDRFITEQLAGDELAGPTGEMTAERIQLLTATGFLRMAPDGTASGGIDQNLARNQVIADTLQIVGSSLMGMTLHCAQCHDHRYDPISQVDYYRLRAIFEPAFDWKKWKTPAGRQISLYTDADRESRTSIEAEAKVVDADRKERVDYYITKTLEQELLLLDDELREPLRTAYRTEPAKRTDEQKKLLEGYPTVGRLSEGALYLYDRRREARAKDLETKRDELKQLFLAAAKQSGEESLTEGDQAKLDVYTQAAAEIRKDRIKTELQTYADQAAEIRKQIPKEQFIRALAEAPGALPETFFYFRGDHDQPKQKLEPAGLSVLNGEAAVPVNNEELPTSGRRLQFARYLTSGSHPLVARVLVNRIWMHHFGRGLVNSPSDFGVLGEQPTHPKLLDWLASEFVSSSWSMKHLHRLIMNSAVYQQSSHGQPELVEADPENRFYSRASLRRLESETLRDAVLAVSGRLNEKVSGEPVPVMEDAVGQIVLGKENLDGERKPTKAIPLNGEEFRRSLYIQVRRTRPLGVLETFDAPAMSPNCEKRVSSNVAPQALLLMNSDFVVAYSDHFAERLINEAGEGIRDQIELGWRLAFGNAPSVEEASSAEQYIERQRQAVKEATPDVEAEKVHAQALATFCQALISSSRFLYVE